MTEIAISDKIDNSMIVDALKQLLRTDREIFFFTDTLQGGTFY